jgi:hypothetical protein
MRKFPLARDQRGAAYTYVVGVAAIFITIVVWHVLTGPMETIMGVADNLRPPENTLGGKEARDFQISVWSLLPFLIVLGIILWMFVSAYRDIYGHGITG